MLVLEGIGKAAYAPWLFKRIKYNCGYNYLYKMISHCYVIAYYFLLLIKNIKIKLHQ